MTAIAMPATKQTPATASAMPASRSCRGLIEHRDEPQSERDDGDSERVIREREEAEEERHRGEQPAQRIGPRAGRVRVVRLDLAHGLTLVCAYAVRRRYVRSGLPCGPPPLGLRGRLHKPGLGPRIGLGGVRTAAGSSPSNGLGSARIAHQATQQT